MSIPPPPEDTMTGYNPSLPLLVALLGCCHITALAEQVTTLGKLPGMRMITVAANQAQMPDADYYGLSGLQKAIRDLPELSPDNPAEIRLCGMFHATLLITFPVESIRTKRSFRPKNTSSSAALIRIKTALSQCCLTTSILPISSTAY